MEIYWQCAVWALTSLAIYRRCVVIIWIGCCRSDYPNKPMKPEYLRLAPLVWNGLSSWPLWLLPHFGDSGELSARRRINDLNLLCLFVRWKLQWLQHGSGSMCLCFRVSVGVCACEMGIDTSERDVSRYVIWHNVSPARTPSCSPTCHRSCTMSKQMLYQ